MPNYFGNLHGVVWNIHTERPLRFNQLMEMTMRLTAMLPLTTIGISAFAFVATISTAAAQSAVCTGLTGSARADCEATQNNVPNPNDVTTPQTPNNVTNPQQAPAPSGTINDTSTGNRINNRINNSVNGVGVTPNNSGNGTSGN
jgi:hypothetical protein